MKTINNTKPTINTTSNRFSEIINKDVTSEHVVKTPSLTSPSVPKAKSTVISFGGVDGRKRDFSGRQHKTFKI